jgi:hypothetical protein
MLLHIDGSQHRWFCDDRWYDLLVIMDYATSEVETIDPSEFDVNPVNVTKAKAFVCLHHYAFLPDN